MSPEFERLCASLYFQCADLFIDNVFVRFRAGKRLGWRFKHVHKHTHIDMQTQINTEKHTSKRVPGIVTFHILFKSMRDYNPAFRKEERKKTLIESISFKHLKDHLR